MITKILRFFGLVTVRRAALLSSRLHEYYVLCVQGAVEKDFGVIPRPEAIENSRKWWSEIFIDMTKRNDPDLEVFGPDGKRDFA